MLVCDGDDPETLKNKYQSQKFYLAAHASDASDGEQVSGNPKTPTDGDETPPPVLRASMA